MIEVTEGGNTLFLISLQKHTGGHSHVIADFVLWLPKPKLITFFLKKFNFFIRGSVDRSLILLMVVILIFTAILYYLPKYGNLQF